jgi:hypothetical protein
MPIINQAIFTRLDQDGKFQRVVPLANSQVFEEPTNSLNPFNEEMPAIADVCSLVEQKVSQLIVDKKVKSLALNKELVF